MAIMASSIDHERERTPTTAVESCKIAAIVQLIGLHMMPSNSQVQN